MSRRAFDPSLPIARPVRAVPRVRSGAWDLDSLRRFELAAAEGLRLEGPFAAVVRADALLDADAALDALHRSGCEELHVDFGSLGPAGDERAARLAELVDALQRRGLRVHGCFTLGHDHDDVGCFERLIAWVEARRLAGVELELWTPDPGSSTVRRLAAADRVRHRDLRRWDGAHVVVTPAQMSAQTLYRGWVWARAQLDSLGSIWRRRPARLTALPAYLLRMGWAALAPMRARAHERGRLLPSFGVALVRPDRTTSCA